MNIVMKLSFVLFIFVTSYVFAENALLDSDAEFLNKLELCQPYVGEFNHPMIKEVLKREVVGQLDGKCLYIEGMPNDGKMECQFSEIQKSAVIKYYKATFTNKVQSEQASIKDGQTKSTYTVDGEEFENPIQESLGSGDCVVSWNAQ